MIVIYLVLPLALGIAAMAVLAFVWVVRSGQLDDVDTPPRRILFDDEPGPVRCDERNQCVIPVDRAHLADCE